jgi:integrase
MVQKSQAGRSVRVTLGTYPDLTVDQARRAAQAAVADLVRGRDPNADKRKALEARRRTEREALTVASLWEHYRLEEVGPHNKLSTAEMKRRMWERSIKPGIGNTSVRQVTGQDLSAIVRGALRVGARGNVTGGRAAAGNFYRLLHHLFAKALAWRLRPLELGHQLDGIEQPRVPRRERLLADSELKVFLAAIDTDRGAPQVRQAIRLAALTGWRIREVLDLRWEHIRKDLQEIRLPDTKTGFSARPISPAALAVLDGIERRPGVPWVLPGVLDARKPLDYDMVYKAACRISDGAGLGRVTPHILRHRVTTDVASASPNIRTGMAVTGHKSVQAFLRYVHAVRERAREVAAEVGGRLAGLAAGAPGTTVAELEPKHRAGRR